jgi:hypothetical protein
MALADHHRRAAMVAAVPELRCRYLGRRDRLLRGRPRAIPPDTGGPRRRVLPRPIPASPSLALFETHRRARAPALCSCSRCPGGGLRLVCGGFPAARSAAIAAYWPRNRRLARGGLCVLRGHRRAALLGAPVLIGAVTAAAIAAATSVAHVCASRPR